MRKSKTLSDDLKNRKLCKDCKAFIRKFKKWDESKVTKMVLVEGSECKKCRMSYTIYKGMVQAIPLMSKEEEKILLECLECKAHPKFLEASLKTNSKIVKCGKCKILLLTKKIEKFKLGDLPPVKIKFEINENDLKHNIKDGKWNGYPDEFYIGRNLTLFKHGNTMDVIKGKSVGISWVDFTPLWMALLKHHEGDELMQTYFLQSNLTLAHISRVLK